MKNFLLPLAAAVCVTSCWTEELTIDELYKMTSPQSVNIGFTVRIVPFTRYISRNVGKDTIPDNRFGVFAYYTGNDKLEECDNPYMYMKNEAAVRSDNNSFILENDIKVRTGRSSYYAYSPYSAETELVDGIDYVLAREIASQEDLVYSSNIDVCVKAMDIGLMFKHALTKICVKARSLPNDYGHTVMVHSVTLGGVDDGDHFYAAGNFDILSGGSWNSCVTDVTNPLTFTLDGRYLNSTAEALPGEYMPLTDEDSYIMVIPQDFSESGFPLEVKFSIMDGSDVIMDDTLRCRIKADLQRGETYAIELDLTPVPITFSPVVEPWDVVVL